MRNFAPVDFTLAAVGFPARVCVITRRDGEVIRIAEADESLVIDGDTYSPIAGVQISAVEHTSNGEMPSCQIVAIHKTDGDFDTGDIDTGIFDAATVQIYVVDRSDLSDVGDALFTGTIANISYSIENEVRFDVKGHALGARVLMTQKRTPMCRTDLFSSLCQVDPNSYDVATTVAAVIDQFTFTVTGSLAQADGYFNQGVCKLASGVGLEIGNWVQSTQRITSYSPINRLIAAGDSITIYPGCDKTIGAGGCAKFSNQLNFQGEPHFTGTASAAQQV